MLINAKFIHIGERRNYETGIARARIQTRFETFQKHPEKECGGWRRVLQSCDERERYKIEEEKRKKKITTRNISEINN